MEDDLNNALQDSVNTDDRKPVMRRTTVDRSIDGIENNVSVLTGHAADIERQILDLQEQHRHTMRSLAAFKLALRMLQS